MFKGIANVWARTRNLGSGAPEEQYMLAPEMYSFSYNPNSSEKIARAFTADAVLANRSSVEGSRDDSLTLTFEEQTWGQLGFVYNERSKASGAIDLPNLEFTTVPATAPYEISISAWYSAGYEDLIFAQTTERGVWGEVGVLTRVAGAPTAGKYQVNTATPGSEKLVFHSSQAGAPIAYTKLTNYGTGGLSYGGPGASLPWGRFEVWGTIVLPTHQDGIRIYFPQAFITTTPEITLDDGVPQLAVTAKLGTPAGWGKPYWMFNVDSLA